MPVLPRHQPQVQALRTRLQARYKAKLCRGDRYYQKLLPYIHKNPVKPGMVERAVDWPWSSARQFEGRIRSSLVDVDRALSYLAADGTEARRIYAEGMAAPDDGFEPKYDRRVYFCWRENPNPPPGKPMEELAVDIEHELSASLHRNEANIRPLKVSAVRQAFARRALAEGHRASAIAKFLGVTRSAVSHALALAG